MKGLIVWFIKNPVASNLLMLIIIAAGIVGAKNINNEFFPDFQPSTFRITVPYPGAGPLEVEEQITLKIEEAISDVVGLKKISSTSSQSLATLMIETNEGWDLQQAIADVKTRVDAISTFPLNVERPIVSDLSFGKSVLDVVVSGGDDELAIKNLTLKIKDEISRLPGVSEVRVSGIRDSQVSVEVPENTLRAYGLTLNDIAQSINRSSLNLPAGQMRNPDGDIQLQVQGQGYFAEDFKDIVVIENIDGSQVKLVDIAKITDNFQEKNFLVELDGRIAAELTVLVGDQPDTIGTSKKVREFLKTRQDLLPDGFNMTVRNDKSTYLSERLGVLVKNSVQGLALVFILLLLFLRPRLALWVSLGIAVAYLGTIAMMGLFGVSMNVTSSFAFLLILGIVVDDAIVVSENIYSMHERKMRGYQAAIKGVTMISKPVILAVLTTIIVFFPMLAMKGDRAQIFAPIPIVAITALTFSLIESLLILPSHLSYLPPEKEPTNFFSKSLSRSRQYFNSSFIRFSEKIYQPLLDKSLRHTGATMAIFFAGLMVCLSIFIGGWITVQFAPSIQVESIKAQAKFQEGVGFSHVLKVKQQLVKGVEEIKRQPDMKGFDGESVFTSEYVLVNSNIIELDIGLIRNEERAIATTEIEDRLLEAIGPVQGVENFGLTTSFFGLEKDVNFKLSGSDLKELNDAATYIKNVFSSYDSLGDISDSLDSSRQEIRIELKPYAEVLGVHLNDVARQVRHAFYGAEAQRIPQFREDVKVMVRYPADQRSNIEMLEDMRITLTDGTSVPFLEVATASFAPGFTSIERVNRQRVITVSANVVSEKATASEMVSTILKNYSETFNAKFPHTTLALDGVQEEEGEFVSSILIGTAFALFLIYTLLAVEFKSYLQPIYILVAVPFGVAGSIIGHLVMGLEFSMPSTMGILATAGVVVNANLVLIDYINILRREGLSIEEAVKQAAKDRLRPIVLTSITTFFGLMPILLEPSVGAYVLKPLVVSLSFGVVLATGITLLMVPAMYLALENLKLRLGFKVSAEVAA